MTSIEMVYYSVYADFSIGTLYIASTEQGICACHSGGDSPDGLLGWLQKHFREETICHDQEYNQGIERQLREYFSGHRQQFELTYDMRGTEFQIRVWQELQKIPYGQTITYGELARRVGEQTIPELSEERIIKNPIGIIVPCHRVIGSNGTLVGYAGGLDMKRKLLQLEMGSLFPME